MGRIVILGLVVVLFCGVAIAQEKGQKPPYIGEITNENVNVRIKPSADEKSTIVGILHLGDKVGVVGEEKDFLQIFPLKGAKVWINSRNVKKEGDEGTVTGKDIPVRSDSRLAAEALGKVTEGEKVNIIREHSGWYQIEAPKSTRFWIYKKYVKFVEGAKDDEELWAKLTGELPPLKESEEVLAKLKEAKEIITAERAKLEKDNVKEMDYTKAIANLEFVSANAKTEEIKKDADMCLQIAKDNQKLVDSVKKEALSREELRKKILGQIPKPEDFVAVGILDSTGAILKYRPGTHKLISGGKIVCFLKGKDEAMTLLMSKFFNEFVGVNGQVINDPPGWAGYKVVIVEEIKLLTQ